jgi:hypothetical protein
MAALRNLWSIVSGLLRELSDEAAYERYLRLQGREHSGEEWRRFTDRRFRAKYARAKCC